VRVQEAGTGEDGAEEAGIWVGEIYQMLKKGEYHYGRDPVNHEMKMCQYRRFLE
jgi:predicted transcriptional regulator